MDFIDGKGNRKMKTPYLTRNKNRILIKFKIKNSFPYKFYVPSLKFSFTVTSIPAVKLSLLSNTILSGYKIQNNQMKCF